MGVGAGGGQRDDETGGKGVCDTAALAFRHGGDLDPVGNGDQAEKRASSVGELLPRNGFDCSACPDFRVEGQHDRRHPDQRHQVHVGHRGREEQDGRRAAGRGRHGGEKGLTPSMPVNSRLPQRGLDSVYNTYI